MQGRNKMMNTNLVQLYLRQDFVRSICGHILSFYRRNCNLVCFSIRTMTDRHYRRELLSIIISQNNAEPSRVRCICVGERSFVISKTETNVEEAYDNMGFVFEFLSELSWASVLVLGDVQRYCSNIQTCVLLWVIFLTKKPSLIIPKWHDQGNNHARLETTCREIRNKSLEAHPSSKTALLAAVCVRSTATKFRKHVEMLELE